MPYLSSILMLITKVIATTMKIPVISMILNGVNSIIASSLPFNPESPGAKPLLGMTIRRTSDALSFDFGIDGPRKIGVFNKTCRLAGIILHPFAFSGCLYPAVIHLKKNAVWTFVSDRLYIDLGIHAQLQCLFQPFDSWLLRKV